MIIVVYWAIAIPNPNKFDLRRVKKASFIQNGNRKSGPHALVFSQTLEHGNSKN